PTSVLPVRLRRSPRDHRGRATTHGAGSAVEAASRWLLATAGCRQLPDRQPPFCWRRALRYAHGGPAGPRPTGPAPSYTHHTAHPRRGIDEHRPALACLSNRGRPGCHVGRVSLARPACALVLVPVHRGLLRPRP